MLDQTVEERILCALHHEEGDRVPIWDYIDNRGIYEYFNPDGEEDYARGMVRVYHGLGIDLCRGYGASYSADQDGQVFDRGDIEQTISGRTCWQSKRRIRSLEDLKAYEVTPVDPAAVQANWVDAVRRQQDLFAPYTMYVPGGGCGFHATYDLMGLSLFSTAIYDARDEVERILWAMNANQVQYARIAAEAKLCPIYFIGDDIAYKGTTMFSPQFLRETFIECLRRTAEPLNNAGIKVIFHSDGNVLSVLDDMIEAGIDGLNPIEPIAGMDIGYLKKRYGKRLVLVGNVDCSQVLPLGTREEVIEATKACIRVASPGGGHLIGSSSEIVPATPVDNILTFYEAARTYGRYPILV